jgi:glutamyl-tRNA synthetase
MSKRYAAFEEDGQQILVLAQDYIEAGYLPEAMRNFLTNIGWNYGDDIEIFSTQEAIARFDLTDVNHANSAFPIEKLDWLNGQYIQMLDVTDLSQRLKPFFAKSGLHVDDERLLKITPALQVRIKTLVEAVPLAGFIFEDWSAFKAPRVDMLIPKKMDASGTVKCLEAAVTLINKLEDFSHSNQYENFKTLAKELGVKNGQLFGVLRVAITSQDVSPPTFETMETLGKEESMRRIKLAIDQLKERIA